MTSETKQVWSIDVLAHVRVEVPVGVEVNWDRAVELAMSAVTQFHEVDCGDSVGHIRWAGIHADVEDNECVVINSPDSGRWVIESPDNRGDALEE